LGLGQGSFDWLPDHIGPESLGFKNQGVMVIYNFGDEPIEITGEVLLASEKLKGKFLLRNQCAWFRP